MASITIPQPLFVPSARSYSTADWDLKRGVITELYRGQGKSLKQVHAILIEQYDFRPTIAMLKKRINKWSLDKKRKAADMLRALRIALEREAQGKNSIFLDRGRLVTFEDIKYYFKRKGIHDLHEIAAGPIAPPPSDLLTCHTPPAPELEKASDPGQLLPDDFIGEFNLEDAPCPEPTSLVLFDYDQTTLPTATRSEPLMHLLTANSNYYESMFDNPRWKEQASSFDISYLELFYHSMYDGQALLEAGIGTLAFQKFDTAFNFVRNVLNQRVLLFLPYVYHMMLRFGNIHDQEVIVRLLEFIARMTETCYSQSHPIKRAVSALVRMSPAYRAFSAARALHCSLDYMTNKIDPVCQDSPHWRRICPSTESRELPDDTGDRYQQTAIAVRNLISDVGSFNTAVASGAHTPLVDRPPEK